MLAYGVAGVVAGFAFRENRLPRKRTVMGIFGFVSVVLLIGPLLDSSTVFLALPSLSFATVWPVYLSGLPVNLSQGLCTFLILFFFGIPLLEKLDRVKLQYGMLEDEDGL